MTTALIATEVLTEIEQHGAPLTDEVKICPDNIENGQFVAQGDINLWRIPGKPEAAAPAARDPQLAPGSSRGSRHCIRQEDMGKVEFYGFPNPTALEGPILLLKERTVIEHPEHKHISLPAGWWGVTYQRRHAEELRRIAD